MTPNQIGFALLYLGLFLLIGKWLRVKVKWLQNLFVPSSIIGGFVALLVGPQVLGKLLAPLVGDASFFVDGVIPSTFITVWKALPGLMINVVFATLFLGTVLPSMKKVWRLAGPQLAFGWTVGFGQYVVGMIVTLLVLTPFFGLPPIVGSLIEIAFEGGHGTAAGMASTFEKMGFSDGYDLSIGLATVGLLSGVIFGMILINWAVRKGHTKEIKNVEGFSDLRKKGIMEFQNREPGITMTVRAESIEPLSLHFAFVGLAILVGWLILKGLVFGEEMLFGSELMTYIPLFPLAMIGSIIVQAIFTRMDSTELMDRATVNRIQGFALDILIVSAIGTISLEVLGTYMVPFLLLAATGVAWNIFSVLVLAPRILPTYWFERAIGDFGQATGVTATGLLLMRVVDPENKTPAFESFGYKQLIFEPFLGGGFVTALSVPFIFKLGAVPFLIFAIVMLLIGLIPGLFYFGKMKESA
ncbi:sodium:glutamate symporter [Savagea sp. SN6]|uniref:Sodium:glutamate symporter n=1 Tax=Savagea serpentis TaxID=2785297 RepID=A0A8J7KSS1_9BACL|nr:sodium/glutamate symporter [Savagea serpentis]MBF4500859.1 sodium:glutamate symporter [Savagea serpentis]